MGDYIIIITGKGQHHNNQPEDADAKLSAFVDQLLAGGHQIRHASISIQGQKPQCIIGIDADVANVAPPRLTEAESNGEPHSNPFDAVHKKLDELLSQSRSQSKPTPKPKKVKSEAADEPGSTPEDKKTEEGSEGNADPENDLATKQNSGADGPQQ